jgi:galactokinase
VLLGSILNHLFNGGKISPEKIAAIGQFAENAYFGKPCGLMDQMASAVGGVVQIDFANPEHPAIKRLSFDLNPFGYCLLILNTGGSHADLTPHYAAIPGEMKKVAGYFGKTVLREISLKEILSHLASLRQSVGDRAVLRALHFFEENERVLRQVQALEKGNIDRFLEEIKASGNSSWKWLQNIAAPENPREQGVALGLALTEHFIENWGKGACRVHGGGFAGTIQVFLPVTASRQYRQFVEGVFGKGSVFELSLRPIGAVAVRPSAV